MKKFIGSLIAFAPVIAFAQPIVDVNTLTYKLTNLGNVFIQILIALAVIFIIFNVIRFIFKSDDPVERAKYRGAVLWGIVGLAVILSIWGLVRILTNTFRTDTNVPANQIPQNPFPNQIP